MYLRRSHQGFTVVELIVVVVVIAILAGIVILAYGSWRDSVSETAVKSDLQGVATAMDVESNATEGGFPLSLPNSFTPSDSVNLTYISGSGSEYCIQGVSAVRSSILWHVEKTNTKKAVVAKGACP